MADRLLPSNQCPHASIKRDTHGWRCDDCLRMFFPSGDTGAEQECVRLREALKAVYKLAGGHATECQCRQCEIFEFLEPIVGNSSSSSVVETRAPPSRVAYDARGDYIRQLQEALSQLWSDVWVGGGYRTPTKEKVLAALKVQPEPSAQETNEHSVKGLASAGSSAAVNPRGTVGGSAEPSGRPDNTVGDPECFGSAGAPRSDEEFRARVGLPPKASAPPPGGSAYRVRCARCNTEVNLVARDGFVNLHQEGAVGWYFSTETGWLCPADASK